MTPDQIRAGQIVHVGPACSVQFAGRRAFDLRVIGWETSWSTPDGWIHLSGYQLDDQGRPVEKRTVFVQHDGLELIAAATTRLVRRVPRNDPPGQRVPRPRIPAEPTTRRNR